MDLAPVMAAEGIELWGICPTVEPPHYAQYADWVDRGRHGSMSYLKSHLALKRDPGHLLEGARSIIVVAVNYAQEPPADPRIARYALGRDYHRVLRAKLIRIAQALPEGRHRICIDSAPLMERDFAQMAGIGWYGKNTMIINSRRGSWFVLGFLLTTLELPYSSPAEGGCGTCTRCIDACPTGAIIFAEDRWQVNAQDCISYLTIEHKGSFTDREAEQIGSWTFGCDICQEVCPFNSTRTTQPMRAAETSEPGFRARSWPTTESLASISETDWDEITRGSPVRRAGHDGLIRNARANLKNRLD